MGDQQRRADGLRLSVERKDRVGRRTIQRKDAQSLDTEGSGCWESNVTSFVWSFVGSSFRAALRGPEAAAGHRLSTGTTPLRAGKDHEEIAILPPLQNQSCLPSVILNFVSLAFFLEKQNLSNSCGWTLRALFCSTQLRAKSQLASSGRTDLSSPLPPALKVLVLLGVTFNRQKPL